MCGRVLLNLRYWLGNKSTSGRRCREIGPWFRNVRLVGQDPGLRIWSNTAVFVQSVVAKQRVALLRGSVGFGAWFVVFSVVFEYVIK